jgi:ribosomal protein S18 acetylase RimI-like enzyme
MIIDIDKTYIDNFWVSLKDLSSDLGWDYWSKENFIMDLPGKWRLSFAVELNGKIAGYCICSIKPDAVWLHHIIIGKEYRGKGLGKLMLEELRHRAACEGINKIALKVGQDNTAAIEFYMRNQFTEIEINNGYITMEKMLNKI